MTRLLVDYVRRVMPRFAVLGLLALVPWWSAPLALGWLLLPVTALALGPGLAAAGFFRREILLLPRSRQDLWRSMWIAGVLLPIAWMVLGMTALSWLGVADGHSSRVVGSVYLFALLAGFVGLVSLRPRATIVWFAVAPVTGIIVLWGHPWPRWGEMSPAMQAFILIGGILGAIGFWKTPPRIEPGRPAPAPTARVRDQSERGWRRFMGTRRGGVPAFIRRQVGGAVLAPCAFVMGVTIVGHLIDPSTSFAQWAGGLLADHPTGDVSFFWINAAVIGTFALAGQPRTTMREMRVLPLSTWLFVAVFTVRPLLIVSVLWLLQGVGYLAATGHSPISIRLDAFLLLAGLTAMGTAVSRGLPASGWPLLTYSGIFIGVSDTVLNVLAANRPLPMIAEVMLAGAAVLAMFASGLINHWTITRRSHLYRRRSSKLEFGFFGS